MCRGCCSSSFFFFPRPKLLAPEGWVSPVGTLLISQLRSNRPPKSGLSHRCLSHQNCPQFTREIRAFGLLVR